MPCIDDLKGISGILYIIEHSLHFLHADCIVVFSNIVSEPAKISGEDGRLTIDAAHLKAHLTAASLLKRALPRYIGPTKGGTQNATLSATMMAGRYF